MYGILLRETGWAGFLSLLESSLLGWVLEGVTEGESANRKHEEKMKNEITEQMKS